MGLRLICPDASGILVLQPWIKPTSPVLEGRFLTTEPPRGPLFLFYAKFFGYKNSIAHVEDLENSHPLEKEMATHSSVLAWRIPGTGEPGGLPSMGSHRVGHD